jgi:alkanesulfonate monooxygenase SsuD/methylene tetrahydromethanopterin reductase-like flavin-dependent oxidoreductase (luciferase family)
MIPGTTGEELVEFATRGERAGFSSLGALDRLIYNSYEPLTALAAAAAVTERIGLTTAVLLTPYRLNGPLLAKEAASVQRISGGRLTLGVGLGWRPEDYEVSGAEWSKRGRELDRMLGEIERVFAGEEFGFAGGIGPDVSDAPPKILVGGGVDASFKRAARFGEGWILGGGTPDQARDGKQSLEKAWSDAGREGTPRVAALGYFALGDNAEESAREDLTHYYAAMGEETANQIAASAATDADTVRSYIQAFTEAGVDELFLFPTSADPDQVDLLAEVAL